MKGEYFDWMCGLIDCVEHPVRNYRKLLSYLNSIEYQYILPMDGNRYEDGVDLRYRYAYDVDMPYSQVGALDEDPCSVLEMLVALCFRCEENIMYDADYGDRTGNWFWDCIVNLGLDNMTNSNFDKKYVSEIVQRFMDGEVSIVRIDDPGFDPAGQDIWSQMMHYLTQIMYGGRE